MLEASICTQGSATAQTPMLAPSGGAYEVAGDESGRWLGSAAAVRRAQAV